MKISKTFLVGSLALAAIASAQGPGWIPYSAYPSMGYNPQASPSGAITVVELANFTYSTTVNDKDEWWHGEHGTQQFINSGVSMSHEINSGTLQGQLQESYDSDTGVRTHSLTIKAADVSQSTTVSDEHTFTDGQTGTLHDADRTAYTNVTINPAQGQGGGG